MRPTPDFIYDAARFTVSLNINSKTENNTQNGLKMHTLYNY